MNFRFKLLDYYFSRNALPYWCVLFGDLLLLFFSGVFGYWLFGSADLVASGFPALRNSLLVYVLLSLVGIRLFRTYAGIIRYSSFSDLQRVACANLLSLVLSLLVHYPLWSLPEGSFMHLHSRHLIAMFVTGTLLMWGLRLVVRTLYETLLADGNATDVLVYGAMSGGVGLAEEIRRQRPVRFILRGFISHDSNLRHKTLLGEPVYGLGDDLAQVIARKNIGGVLISPHRISDFRSNLELQDLLLGAGVKIFIAPDAEEWDGSSSLDALSIREVDVEDLLPREEIEVDMDSIRDGLSGRRVLITGAAGSIGSELARQVASCSPSALMLIDQAETPMHDMRLMLARDFPDVPAETVVTSISRQSRMEFVFSTFRPEYVFHAAAYKHVPMMEDNPAEAVMNNVYGTKVIADLSDKYGVGKFVMVSTDKAVNPTNVMGCSKRICEIYVQSLSRCSKTQYVTTRFGNVLGSNGSVIPLFREQIRKGGPVTVTHPDIVRFFMLIPEACRLVLEAGVKGGGGEIFVFDMGKPVRIVELAERMIRLSGAKGVGIEYTGLRDGEKLYEEVLSEQEGTKPSFHEKIRIAEVREYDYAQVSVDIDDLVAIARQFNDMETVRKMKEIVPEYKSNNSKYDVLDK